MGMISYFGGFGTSGMLGGIGKFHNVWVGGNGDLPLWWDLLVVGIFSLGIYYLAVANRLTEPEVDNYVSSVYPPMA
jgi:hypothetical protein